MQILIFQRHCLVQVFGDAFFPHGDDPPPIAFVLAVLRMVVMGRGAVPCPGGRSHLLSHTVLG